MCIIYVLPNCQNSQFCGANFQLRAGKKLGLIEKKILEENQTWSAKYYFIL